MNFFEKNKNKIFKKCTDEEIIVDINNFIKGRGNLIKTINHFFEEEIFKCKRKQSKITPLEALKNDKIINNILKYIQSKPKFFKNDDITNIKSYFRNSGHISRKVSNFPAREALKIYQKYSNQDDIIFDMSCGFGSRMSACLLSGRKYIGTDPNKSLFKKLKEYEKYLIDNDLISKNACKIYCQGSEIKITELINTIDLCFSSPPYFNLEEYSTDKEQSIIKYDNYYDWLDFYAKKTINNCEKYLKKNKYLLINIKNNVNNNFLMFDDWKTIAEQNKKLKYIKTEYMLQFSKKQYKPIILNRYNENLLSDFDRKEPIMVFKKI